VLTTGTMARQTKTFVEDIDAKRYVELGGSKGAAFRKRLELGTPTPDDERSLERARTIATRRKQGWVYAKIGEELAITAGHVAKFVSQGVYKSALLWLEREKISQNAVITSPLEGRAFLGKLVPKALRRLELSLDSGVKINEHGLEILLESKAADNAMETVLDAVGLTGPESVVQRPTIHIDTLVIQQLSRGIMEDDAIIEARQRPLAITVGASEGV